jgi:O-antigen/teichoic acid export membrane protein
MKNYNLAQTLFSGALWAFLARVIGIISGIVVNALLARLLTTEEMGAYFLTVSLVVFFSIITRVGLKQTLVKFVAGALVVNNVSQVLNSVKIAYKILIVSVATFSILYYIFFEDLVVNKVFSIPDVKSATGVIVIWVFLLAMQVPISETLRGMHRIKYAVFFDGVIASVILSVILLYIKISDSTINYNSAVTLTSGSVFIAVLVGTVFLNILLKKMRGSNKDETRIFDVLKISIPLLIVDASNYVLENFGIWIVASYLTAEDVAMYGAAWKIVSIISMPLLLVNMSIQPIIANLYKQKNEVSLNNALRGTATMAAIPSLFVLLIMLIYKDEVIALLYGENYAAATEILMILCLGQFINVFTGSCGWVLAFTGHHNNLMAIKLIAAGVSFPLLIYTVQTWGVVGVAIVISATTAMQNIVTWQFTRKLTGLWTHMSINPRFVYIAARKLLNR